MDYSEGFNDLGYVQSPFYIVMGHVLGLDDLGSVGYNI
jgi:hypothetical protein